VGGVGKSRNFLIRHRIQLCKTSPPALRFQRLSNDFDGGFERDETTPNFNGHVDLRRRPTLDINKVLYNDCDRSSVQFTRGSNNVPQRIPRTDIRSKQVCLDVTTHDQVDRVVSLIAKRENFPSENVDVVYDKKWLDRKKPLGYYGIEAGCTIHFITRPQIGPIPIFVKTLTGYIAVTITAYLNRKTLRLIMLRDYSVQKLKSAIEDWEGIPVDEIRLIYAGKLLEDGVTLASYDIRAAATLHLILRLRGGWTPETLSPTVDVIISKFVPTFAS
jgi:hypothetical protein